MPRNSGSHQLGVIDSRIADAIRLLRILRGLSQQKLAGSLGVTFQQVQKYEKARTRISSSRLYQIAHVLGVPIEIFFRNPEVAGEGNQTVRDVADLYKDLFAELGHREFVELNRAFATLPSADIRAAILGLVGDIASSGEPAPAQACQRKDFPRPVPKRRRQHNGGDEGPSPETEERSGRLTSLPELSERMGAMK